MLQCENRVLKRTLEANGEEGIGGWRKLHSEELHDLESPSG